MTVSTRLSPLVLVAFAASWSGCEPDRCPVGSVGSFCADEEPACTSSADCADDAVCCNGACRSDDIDDLCGCEAAVGGAGPTSCEEALCVVDGARATRDNVQRGTCGCPCDPSRGGTLCALDATAADGFSCSCDRTDPAGTCEGPALDAAGIPHRPADTCSPQNACVCFAAGAVCGGSADCTFDGCVDLVHDAAHCGVAGRSCTDETTGTVDGVCHDGGCACDAASDCVGDGLNVDSCVFVGATSQCVCDGYRHDDVPAACPMGLACAVDGCVVDGVAYGTHAALVAALTAR